MVPVLVMDAIDAPFPHGVFSDPGPIGNRRVASGILDDLRYCSHVGNLSEFNYECQPSFHNALRTHSVDIMGMTWWQRFEEARERLGLSRVEVARRAKLTPESVQKYGTGAVDNPRGDTVARLARAVQTTESWLRTGIETNTKLPEQSLSLPRRHEIDFNVPVLGTGEGGIEGSINMGDSDEFIGRPASLKGVENVYALMVTGDSMEPAFESGDPVFVSPTRPKSVGDYVVIQCQIDNGEQDQPLLAFIKRIARRRGKGWEFEQLNPAMPWSPPGPVVAVHRIYRTRDLYLV